MCISGYVYVDLCSEEEVKKALKKNKDYIGDQLFSFLFLFLCVCVLLYFFFDEVMCSGKNIYHQRM